MANRKATISDASTFAAWITANIDGMPLVPYDAIFDTYTNPTPKGIFINGLDEESAFSESLTGTASGNTSGLGTFAVTGTIDTDRPDSGVFKVADGLGGYDVYKYSSYAGSLFTLDVSEHPGGLVRSYAGSEQVYASYLRIGFTMWVSSDTFDGDISYFNVVMGDMSSLLHPASNPGYKRPLNGRVKYVRLNTESSNVCVEIDTNGAMIINGELRSTYPGLRHGISDKYIWNQFGFWLTDSELNRNVRMCSITGENLQGAGFIGVCAFHGFARFRAARTNDNQELQFFIWKRCAALFGIGEGGYILQTTDNAANPIVRRVEVEDIICAFNGNEPLQIQNMSSKGGYSYIRNIVGYASGTMWKHAFQPNQKSGLQTEVQDADNGFFIGDIIIQGYGSYGLHMFSSDKSARGYTAGSGILKYGNIVLAGARLTGPRNHGSSQYGPEKEIRGLYILDINDTVSELTNESLVDYMMESADEVSKTHLIGVKYKSGKSEFFASSGASTAFANTYSRNISVDDTLPAIEYINNGFTGVDVEKFEIWNDLATQDTGSPNIDYLTGDILINAVLDGDFGFYPCIQDHTAATGTANRPDLDATNYGPKYTWDLAYIRNDQPGHNSGDPQSIYPPCDYRLVQDSFWANLGVGLSFNPQPSDEIAYQYQYTKDGSTFYDIAGATKKSISRNNYDYLSSGDTLKFITTTPKGHVSEQTIVLT